MKYLFNAILVLLALLLSNCAFVSKDIHPELTYRKHPFVEIKQHESWFSLQSTCFQQHKTFDIYMGCAWVPIDPKGICKINIMKGDSASLAHELKHCHGYADTMNPFNAQAIGE